MVAFILAVGGLPHQELLACLPVSSLLIPTQQAVLGLTPQTKAIVLMSSPTSICSTILCAFVHNFRLIQPILM